MTPQSAPEDSTPETAPEQAPVKKASWFNLKAFVAWMAAFAAVYVGLAIWGYAHDGAPAGAPMGEQVGPDEVYETTSIVQSAIETSVQQRAALIEASKNSGGEPPKGAALPGVSIYRYNRDAHAKGHGCVLATFKVNDHVDTPFQYGIFKDPGKTYEAIIRFSNGNPAIQADSAKDPRGMAIKLRDVPGPKLMPGEGNDTTQDFIMMNNPVFFIRTLAEYTEFNHLLTMEPSGIWPITKAYFLQASFNPLNWHLRELKLALGAGKSMPDSLVTERYWSASAYALGPRQFIKFSAIPCADNKPMKVGGKGEDDPDYLRRELARHSAEGKGCFDFAVQPQVLGKKMPVEDTTVEWSESDSPFTPVARIQLEKVDNTSAEMYDQCENTAFNPWHALPDHRPVGVMNRVRQALYGAMSRFRQDQNCKDACDTKCNTQKWPDSACAGAAKPADEAAK
jgi:Catalase